MAGRHAKPIALHLAQGNPNRLTKAEIERRKKTEIKLGDNKLKCPDYVKRDVIAYTKWKEITKIYKDIDFVSSGDVGLLGRYCKTFSEYHSLVDCREKIMNSDLSDDEIKLVNDTLTEEYGERKAKKLFEKIDYILSTAGVLSIDTAINKKMDMLIKMEDRLFLNPLAKVKNVPKKEPEQVDQLAAKGFGNV